MKLLLLYDYMQKQGESWKLHLRGARLNIKGEYNEEDAPPSEGEVCAPPQNFFLLEVSVLHYS